MDIYPFKPTYLYVKRHAITGKLYFGKTSKDPEKYLGSGKHWVRHIKTHGVEHVETLWYCLFLDQDSLTKFALNFSEQQNIAESEEWLNLRPENGLDGNIPGMPLSEEHRSNLKGHHLSAEHSAKLVASRKGKPMSEEHKKKIAESLRGKTGPRGPNKKKKQLSEEHKNKIRSSLITHHSK